MATIYAVKTNGVTARTFTSKARAIAEAERIGKAAEERGKGDSVVVETERTGKRVFTYFLTYAPQAETPQAEESMEEYVPETFAQSEECACSKGAPSPGNNPCLHCGGDNSWCPKHYPAPQFKDAEGNDTYSTPTFPAPAQDAQDAPVSASEPMDATPARVRVSGPCEWTRTDSEGEKHACAGGMGFGRADAVHKVRGKRLCAYHSPMDTTPENLAQFGWEDARPASVWVMNTSGYWIEYAVIPNGDPHRVDHFLNLAKAIPAYKSTAHVRYIGDPTPTPVKDAPMASLVAPSVDNFPNARAYKSATENADDMCREQGFTQYGPEWLRAFNSSYAYSLEIQAEEENNTRYVGVRQGPVGFSAPEHVHAVGCRDIAREMKRWGQKESDTFSYHAGITYADLTFDNWGDVASDNHADPYNEREAWLDMLSWMNDDLSGVKIMPCAQKMELGDTPFGPIVRDGAYYTIEESPIEESPIEESPIEESPVSEPISQSGVTDCTECGAHIMVNDITVPSQCEDGCPEDTRTPEDMADTMTAPLTIEAQLSVVVDGVTIDLGWHEFTLSAGQTEHDIPAMYGEKNGTWSRPGAPDWASVITVTATGACWH